MLTRRLFIALVAAALLSSCGGTTPTPSSSWRQLKETTACEAMNPAYCVGAFGFAVESDGRFTVGPAPDGSSITGVITNSERQQIDADANAVAANLNTGEECDTVATVPGSSQSVDLELQDGGSAQVVARGVTFGSVCYRGGRAAATRLETDLADVMSRYYPRPFPR
jgi:hypothetical protein